MTASQSVSRRIPVQSIKGPDATATDSLKWLYYLIEVERQGQIFNSEFQVAVRAGQDGQTDEAWCHLQSAMFAGIIVSRLVTYGQDPKPDGWPGSRGEARQKAKEAKKKRVAKLRSLLALPEDENFPIYQLGLLRNSLEHVDEWMDRALAEHSSAESLSDWYLAGRYFLRSPESVTKPDAVAGLRGFAPESGFAVFHVDEFDLFNVDLQMLKIRRKSREVQAMLLRTLKGRLVFGGGQLAGFERALSRRVEGWAEERARMEAAMPPVALIDGRVRLWLQVEE
ncbi:hypothetical protein [Micromonospora noduli]|uniref:hypothetical protein n=1 Tax=Micromonospora noduli TaxID=709876 RepID=UPI0015EC067E|nr:hypothetical protein [Micromonospora noduli]